MVKLSPFIGWFSSYQPMTPMGGFLVFFHIFQLEHTWKWIFPGHKEKTRFVFRMQKFGNFTQIPSGQKTLAISWIDLTEILTPFVVWKSPIQMSKWFYYNPPYICVVWSPIYPKQLTIFFVGSNGQSRCVHSSLLLGATNLPPTFSLTATVTYG